MNSATGATTRIGNFRTFSITRELNLETTSTDATILRLVGKNKRVLELGCGSGDMSQGLCEQGCTVVGIEINPDAAAAAARICERVVIGDLDYIDLEQELGTDKFEVVLAADVLEHLKDPLSILQAVKPFLLPHGYVVISIPNVAHISVRLALLGGKFPYGKKGLLDQTHLRFVTRESLEKLMEDADLAIGRFERITNVPGDPAHFEVPYFPGIVPAEFLEQLLRDPEALTYQFVLSGYPLPQSGLQFVFDRFKEVAREADAARREAERLRAELASAQLGLRLLAEAEQRIATSSEEKEALEAERDALAGEVLRLQESAVRSEQALESLRSEVDSRNLLAEEQERRIIGLQAQIETLLAREKDLRDMLLEAHDQLLKRDEEIALTLASALPQGPAQPQKPAAGSQSSAAAGGKYLQYQQLVQKIREVVRTSVPAGSEVLVISKGDDDLLQIPPCKGAHFPQRKDGRYTGYYPADGETAVDHLRELRNRGAQFLLMPQTAFWWLDHYPEFANYLEKHCARIVDDPAVCIVFDMVNAKKPPKKAGPVAADGVSRRPFGVNISGNISSEKGVGEAVRGQARSLQAVGVPVALNNILEDTAVNIVNEFTNFSEDNPYAVNLIHLNADALLDFVELREKGYLEERYNVGFWAWETSTFPSQWWDRFDYLDEIWVGSDFVLDAISRVSPIPVVKTPLAVRFRPSVSAHPRSHFGLDSKTYIFLFVFDYMSIAERKNPLGLVQAFRNAFSSTQDVMLVLKCAHSDAYTLEAEILRDACRGINVKIIDSVLSRDELNSLMNAADCYVSLHRSEGFGLTLMEAMSLAKPVIATGYSGNMDFMTPVNSYPVNYKLINIDKPYGPYTEGEWADPDLDHAAELMRTVFKNRNEAKQIGRRAQADVLRNWSPVASGTVMRRRLFRLAGLRRIPAPETADTVPVKEGGSYPQLVARVQEIVARNLPGDARLLVVSRGDDDLLALAGRDGRHFPQDAEGKYAGYHPATDAEAIAHLEALKLKGAEYLLFPQTAFWWLAHYSEMRSHLDSRYRLVWSNPDCIIYGLTAEKSNGRRRAVRAKQV